MICGERFKRVCSHVRQAHGMSAREYKEEFGLDVKKGILSDEDREVMRRHALANKMDEQLRKAGAKTRFKKGQEGLGKFKRSQQTRERLANSKLPDGAWKLRGPAQKVSLTCAECGGSFSVLVQKKDHVRFCSQKCRYLNKKKES